MKTRFFFLTCLLAGMLFLSVTGPAKAQTATQENSSSFHYSVGSELVSSYIWRGINFGGLSIQPYASVGYGPFTLGMWSTFGASDYKFNKDSFFEPELYFYLQYARKGFSISVSHLYLFDSKFFDFSNADSAHYKEGDNTNLTEVNLSYTISPRFPLTIEWNTAFAGSDGYYPDPANKDYLKRVYSTYIELRYLFELESDWHITPVVGFAPHRGLYTNYEKGFAFNNINCRVERVIPLAHAGTLSFFAQPVFNLYHCKDFSYKNNFNFVLGVGFYL